MISPAIQGKLRWVAIWLALAMMFAGCAAQQQPQMWRASGIAQSPAHNIRLLDKEKKIHGVVDKATIVKLIEIKTVIENVAGAPPAELVIASGDQPNAFAGNTKAGRVIGINVEMIRLLGSDWDAYAAIIGHEYAHLTLNHSGIRKEREGVRRGASEVLGVILGVAGVPLGGTIASVATTAVATVYTRDEEREADRVGLGYARTAGFDTMGAVRAWQKMSAASQGAAIPFLSTHPASEERLQTMKELAGRSK